MMTLQRNVEAHVATVINKFSLESRRLVFCMQEWLNATLGNKFRQYLSTNKIAVIALDNHIFNTDLIIYENIILMSSIMIKTRKTLLSYLFNVCLVSIFYFFTILQTAEAGNTIIKASRNTSPVKITLVNDGKKGVKTTFFWVSESQPGNGICHKKEVLAGDKASYAFTKKQLTGDLAFIAIVQFPEPRLSNTVQFAYGKISGKNHATISLKDLAFSANASYTDIDKVRELLNLPNSDQQ